VPRYCLVLPEMPLSEGGKVDWRGLHAILDARSPRTPPRPADDVLDEVLRAFPTAIGQPGLAADANFMEAGGDSSRPCWRCACSPANAGPHVGVQDLFDHPTARQMATGDREPAQLRRDRRSGDRADGGATTAAGKGEPIRAATQPGSCGPCWSPGYPGSSAAAWSTNCWPAPELRVLCRPVPPTTPRRPSGSSARWPGGGLWEPRFASRIEG